MGRSIGEIITTVDALIRNGVCLFAVKEGIKLTGKQDLQTKAMLTMFDLFADVERELISMRNKEGLAVAKASGTSFGRL